MTENEIAAAVVDAAFKIHTTLGPGLLESVYQAVLGYELQKRGLRVAQQVGLPLHYEGVKLELGFRIDLIIDEKVIIEIKSVEALAPVHKRQLLTYLKLTDLRLGLLMNFNVALMKNGIHRVVNKLAD
ncbi:MAG TPA: GxxExxY protein [Pyrinomonadaceae bacterium]|nr:GxxExxY protein [Pyrinomonadaceae bacterium]